VFYRLENIFKDDWLSTGILNRYEKSDGIDRGMNEGEDEYGKDEEVDNDEKRCKTINCSTGLIKEHGG